MPVRHDPRTDTYYFRTTIEFPDGTRRRISGTPGAPGRYQDLAPGKVGAQAAERRAIAEVMTGVIGATRKATATKEAPKKKIREYADNFIANYKPGSKPGVRRERRRELNGHVLPFFGDMTIEGLTQSDVDRFARQELTRGMAPKTVNNRLASLSCLIKYATGKKTTELRFKVEGMPGEGQAVAPCDVEKVLAAAPDDRFRWVILLGAEAGLRVGEIRGIQWTDIKDGVLTVRRALDKETNEATAPKHNKTRTVPLSPRLIAALADLRRVGLWVVCKRDGRPLGYDQVLDNVKAAYTAAGVAQPKKAIHALRHTFGSVTARRAPVTTLKELMGHTELSTTMKYVHVTEDDKRDAIAAVFGSAVAANGSKAGAQ